MKILQNLLKRFSNGVAKEFAECAVANAKWELDCQAKQDFDIPLIEVSTRYYPDFTAYPSIVLFVAGNRHGSYITLARTEIKGKSESEVKAGVEQWAREQLTKLIVGNVRMFDPELESITDALRSVRKYHA